MLGPIDMILIQQLLARYGRGIDERDWESFAELFTPDASIDYRGSRGHTIRSGRDEVVAWFQELADTHPPAHYVSNIIIDETAAADGPVEVVSKFLAPFSRPQHQPPRLYGGDYRDIVIKTDDRWRFSFKSCVPDWNLALMITQDGPPHRLTF